MKKKIIIGILAFCATLQLSAREVVGDTKSSRKSTLATLAEGCAAATSSADLSINNVRTRILGSGDFWWDLNDAKYEVPKGSNRHSMFAGALWLGGFDVAGQLRLAAMTYRQDGVDYWPGPLTTDNTASVTAETCERYNRHWIVHRSEVETHAAWIACKDDPDCDVGDRFQGYTVPTSIREWPGNGIDGELPNKLAPYFELGEGSTPGVYEFEFDFPGYNLTEYKHIIGNQDCRRREADLLYGDETIWWVYNDKGNTHTETQAAALGFEIRAQAFAFASNDEVNNMTFNNYRIVNRSTFTLTETYFGTWFDPDLGNPTDDIIGCDINRGLGYCYNADNNDDGAQGYGANPPAVGFDFFQGPFADFNDGVDNDRDGCVDAVLIDDTCRNEDLQSGINERIIMSGFMYYNNRFGFQGNAALTDPDVAQEFYNYLLSNWKNGDELVIEDPSGQLNTMNGDGFVGSNTTGLTETQFAYPGTSFDTTGAYEPSSSVDWWESPSNDGDKRGLHSAGPFSLFPGALNFITTGTVWARDFSSPDAFGSVLKVIEADDKAQQLFDNCFDVLDGPESPTLEIIELDRELIFHFEDALDFNTVGYEEVDPAIQEPLDTNTEPLFTPAERDSAAKAGFFSYRFEGFQVFQVTGPDVSVEDIYDPAQSRLVFQSDIKNDVGQLINFNESPTLGNGISVPQDMTIVANNEGIELSFRLQDDAFAEGDKRLVNNREYYFFVIAYAQNRFRAFDGSQFNFVDPNNLVAGGQLKPYLAGRKVGNGQKPYLAIPNKTENTKGGLVINSDYGDGLPITRLAGSGNSGIFEMLLPATREAIEADEDGKINRLDYQNGNGPIRAKVVDPTSVVPGEFMLTFSGVDKSAGWVLTPANNPSDTLAESEYGLSYEGEQIVDTLGISITVSDVMPPGFDEENVRNNGFIGADLTYPQGTGVTEWLTGVSDNDAEGPQNWILAGTNVDATGTNAIRYSDVLINEEFLDPNSVYENILGGTWAPTLFTSNYTSIIDGNGNLEQVGFGVRPNVNTSTPSTLLPLSQVPNVDVVITQDPSKWTRVPVFELGDIPAANEYTQNKFTLRRDRTLNLVNGQLVPDSDPANTGWSYFPGYAVNTLNGRRLNMAFGEASNIGSENGRDMLWNPTSNLTGKFGDVRLGGFHLVYVFADSAKFQFDPVRQLPYGGDAIENNPYFAEFQDLTLANAARVFSGIAWTGFPLVASEEVEFLTYDQIPSTALVSLRLDQPFRRSDPSDPNDGFPQYLFSTGGLAAETGNRQVAESALDLIKVVPNPYFGSSLYEDSQLDNIVKITNLPEQCQITIFMSNGTLIRTLDKPENSTFVEWDLKNDFNVPIASGVYLIHIDAGDLGETVVKWMGSLRPIDLNAF